MAERPDHFARMRAEEAPEGDRPEGAPEVSPELIEWLEKQQFGVIDVSGTFPNSQDQAVAASHCVSYAMGQRTVLAHLRTLVRKER